MDDDIVNRAIKLYQAQIDDLWFYEEQFARWLAEPLTDSQRQEVSRLNAQLPHLKELSQAILELMDEMKDGTINRIMEKSDLELGLDFSGKISVIFESDQKKDQNVDLYVNHTVRFCTVAPHTPIRHK
ncbi:MAG: hypothetical protein WBF55_19905 [Syntrophobacteria bacterium]